MATLKDIAQALNLSTSTVSRALRNDSSLNIPSETMARILSMADQLGYVVKRKPKAYEVDKQILIIHREVTFRNQIDSAYYFAIRSGIELSLSQEKISYTFLLIEDIELSEQQVDGVILVGNYTEDEFSSVVRKFKSKAIIVVGIVAYFRDLIDQVTYRNYDSVSIALDYLFAKGHQNIAYLGIEEAVGTEFFGLRRDAFHEIMDKRGFYEPAWVMESGRGTDRVEQGANMMRALLKQKSLPTALFCANDPIALGASRAIMEAGMSVPRDFSIVAHDGSYPTQHSYPPLTTVDVHPFQLGVEGVSLLLKRLAQNVDYGRQVLLYPKLIERSSVREI